VLAGDGPRVRRGSRKPSTCTGPTPDGSSQSPRAEPGNCMATVSWSWRTEQNTVRVPCHSQPLRFHGQPARSHCQPVRPGRALPGRRRFSTTATWTAGRQRGRSLQRPSSASMLRIAVSPTGRSPAARNGTMQACTDLNSTADTSRVCDSSS